MQFLGSLASIFEWLKLYLKLSYFTTLLPINFFFFFFFPVLFRWPLAPNGTVFPLIAYAHGFDDVGYVDYSKLFNDMASWGFVIVTPQA